MPALVPDPAATPAAASDPTSITTTLYDLVVALNAEVDPEDDALVTAAVVHLIHVHRARFVGSRTRLALVMPTTRRQEAVGAEAAESWEWRDYE